MKKLIYTLLLVFFSISFNSKLQAQEVKEDSVFSSVMEIDSLEIRDDIHISDFEFKKKPLNMALPIAGKVELINPSFPNPATGYKATHPLPEWTHKALPANPYYSQPLSPYHLSNSGFRFSPMSNNMAWVLNGKQELIPGIGFVNSAGTGIVYQPNSRWTIYAAANAYKMKLNSGGFQDVQFNASATYKITEYLSVTGYGNYNINGGRNMRAGAIPIGGYSAGYKGVGGTLNLRVINTDSFEMWMKGGMEYDYDPMRMKWRWKPVVYPEFRFK